MPNPHCPIERFLVSEVVLRGPPAVPWCLPSGAATTAASIMCALASAHGNRPTHPKNPVLSLMAVFAPLDTRSRTISEF